LDNDDVISMVEDTPTYKRSKEVLASIKSKTAGMDNAADSMAAGTNGEEKSMIVF
jgi:cell division protein FtsZ